MSALEIPLVSVGVPVYNGEQYLVAALSSLQAQTEERLEIIISDNASTDATEEICRTIAAEDPRIRYVRAGANRGAAWNFNNTFRLSSGTYFKWAAADDRHEPQFIERCVAALESDPSISVAYARVVDIGPDDEVLERWGPRPRATSSNAAERFDDVINNENLAFPVFGVVRSDVLARTSLIGPYSGSDWTLLAELALLGRFHEVPEELFLHREHPERSTRVYAKSRDRAAWFDSRKSGKVTFPYWSLARAYTTAAVVLPESAPDRLRSLGSVSRWTRTWWHRLAHELKWGLIEKLPGDRTA